MRRKAPLQFTGETRIRAIASIRRYLAENLDVDIGDLQAELLVDYVVAEHGPVIYNQAVSDARAYLDERVADLGAVCHHEEFTFWDKGRR